MRRKKRQHSSSKNFMVLIMFLTTLIIVGGLLVVRQLVATQQRQDDLASLKKARVKAAASRSRLVERQRASIARSKQKTAESEKPSMPSGQSQLATASAYAYPVAQVKQEMTEPNTSNIKEKVVFLTFDDGPNTVNSPRVLNILNQEGVHGTFFVVGRQLSPATVPVLKAIYDGGNSIGLHSITHNYNVLYPGRVGATAAIEHEAKLEQTMVKQALGPDFVTHLWRYPGGHFSWKGLADADKGLARLGLDWIDWNAAVGDALSQAQEPKTEAAMLQYHLRSLAVYPTSQVRVVLMHDALGKDLTVQTLPKIIAYYRDNGYKFGVLE